MPLRGVGIDIADVTRFARLLQSSPRRFSRRWFSVKEIAECEAGGDPATAFAARFAAKEAVWKALGIDAGPTVPWRSIGIVGGDLGHRAGVVLAGAIREQATRAGIGAITVEWSVEGNLALAVALAEQT